MKHKITAFIQGLINYDYMLFGGVFILFIILIILGILLRKNTAISISIVLLAFSCLFIGPVVGYIKMHEYLFKNRIELNDQKKLTFTKAVVVLGTLKNESKFDFKSCKITASAYKVSGNVVKDYIFKFNPFKNMSIVEHNISREELRGFKIIIEPFTYSKTYNISVKADCKS